VFNPSTVASLNVAIFFLLSLSYAISPAFFKQKCSRAGEGESGVGVADNDGPPYAVRCESVNAKLLNDFRKEQRKVEQ
jgi:hypothetical protein